MPTKKRPYVFARYTMLIMVPQRANLRAGDAWHASHPVVIARPDLFNDEPPEILPRNWEPPVEQASAAPGEKRATRRAD